MPRLGDAELGPGEHELEGPVGGQGPQPQGAGVVMRRSSPWPPWGANVSTGPTGTSSWPPWPPKPWPMSAIAVLPSASWTPKRRPAVSSARPGRKRPPSKRSTRAAHARRPWPGFLRVHCSSMPTPDGCAVTPVTATATSSVRASSAASASRPGNQPAGGCVQASGTHASGSSSSSTGDTSGRRTCPTSPRRRALRQRPLADEHGPDRRRTRGTRAHPRARREVCAGSRGPRGPWGARTAQGTGPVLRTGPAPPAAQACGQPAGSGP